MKRPFTIPVFTLAILFASFSHACNNSANKEVKSKSVVIEAKKPGIDSTKILSRLDLYRAPRFESVYKAVSGTPDQVYKLVLWGKELGEIPPDISRLTYLHSLDVSRNNLTSLPEELAELHYLQGFYAPVNKLTDFPEQIILLPLLDRIDLSENQIQEIPPSIVHMRQLKKLNLYDNSISEIPAEVYQLENLEILTLGKNDIGSVSPLIGNLKKLRKLDLSHNHLKEIPWEVTQLKGTLTDLEIHGNNIAMEEIEKLMEAMPATNIRY